MISTLKFLAHLQLSVLVFYIGWLLDSIDLGKGNLMSLCFLTTLNLLTILSQEMSALFINTPLLKTLPVRG